MPFDIDMNSEHKELLISARKLLSGLMETKKDRITTYSDVNGGISYMRGMKHGIDIGFLKGTRMENKYSLLSGTGKVMRVLSMETLDADCGKCYIDKC